MACGGKTKTRDSLLMKFFSQMSEMPRDTSEELPFIINHLIRTDNSEEN